MADATREPCRMCLNARVDPDLTDDNDFSAHGVGESDPGFRIMIESGWGKPVRMAFERLIAGEWHLAGIYEPKFCPNCGRPLTEYEARGHGEEDDECDHDCEVCEQRAICNGSTYKPEWLKKMEEGESDDQ